VGSHTYIRRSTRFFASFGPGQSSAHAGLSLLNLYDRHRPAASRRVEGSEKSVFEGDTGALNSFPLILMEPHDWMLPGRMVFQPFFRFHLAADREFCMKHENIVSIVRGATEITYV
jgi:hypothetical protein